MLRSQHGQAESCHEGPDDSVRYLKMTRYMRGSILWTAAVSGADYAERLLKNFQELRVKMQRDLCANDSVGKN